MSRSSTRLEKVQFIEFKLLEETTVVELGRINTSIDETKVVEVGSIDTNHSRGINLEES